MCRMPHVVSYIVAICAAIMFKTAPTVFTVAYDYMTVSDILVPARSINIEFLQHGRSTKSEMFASSLIATVETIINRLESKVICDKDRLYCR